MRKKILCLLICMAILIQPINVMATVQIPVKSITIDDVYYVLGHDPVTGKTIIRPTMTVSWQDPSSWPTDPDGKDHTPSYYELKVENITSGAKEIIRIDRGSDEFTKKSVKVHDKIVLDTGSLYKVSIQPYHYHDSIVDGKPVRVIAPLTGEVKSAYAITDLNVELIPDEDSLKVVWDDLGIKDYKYKIVYAVGDFSNKSKQELINNREGEITDLDRDSIKVTNYYDTIKKRNRLIYEIKQNIYPGQIYSVLVQPVTEYYSGKPIVMNRNFPYIWTCSTNINLNVLEDGQYVRLEWKIPASFKVGQSQNEYELVEAKLIEYVNDQPRNVAIFDKKAATMEYYRVNRPTTHVEYQLKLRYKAVSDSNKPPIEPESKKVPFVPLDLKIKPTKPFVPSLITKSIINDLKGDPSKIKDILEQKYLLPGDTYSSNIDNLLNEKRTFNIVEDIKSINFVWGAFKRKDMTSSSPTYGKTIVDTNVYYDIYVTKDLDDLAGAKKIVDNQKYTASTPNNIITNGSNEILGYKYNLDKYYDSSKSDLQKIVQGQMYYIKIVAKKIWGKEESVSQPTIVSVYFGYNGDSFEPPSIVKPPLKVKDEETITTSVSLNWKEQWWEVMSTKPEEPKYSTLSKWAHEVWVVDEGSGNFKMYTKYVEGAKYFKIYDNKSQADELVNYIRQLEGNVNFDVVTREINLGKDSFGVSDVKYKFHKIPYQEIQKEINLQKKNDPDYSFVEYYNKLINQDKTGVSKIPWEDIEVKEDVDDSSYLYYKQDGLLPNTLYLFMVYPYREIYNDKVIMSHYPTPIVVATKPEGAVVKPDPTVPNLYINDYTDTAITLTWKYNTNFNYEVRYSLTEDVEQAQPVKWQLPDDPLDPLYPTDGAYYELKADNLFPNTQYYFWIRSIQPSSNKQSPWSNVTIGTTKDVSNPLPPRGVGIASKGAMQKHNYTKSVDENYLSVEWLLHEDDKEVDKEIDKDDTIEKKFSYLMEVSNNALFIDPIYIEVTGGENDVKPDNVEILEKYLVKVNDLISNRFYYVRMKTRVTVIGKEEGQLIVKDSLSYTEPVRILTKYSSSEYDGNKDPALEILPGEDYEIVYNKEDKELIYRFRSSEKDKDNMADNNVDQRLIMNLIKKNKYVYEIDVNKYKNNPIVKRRILMPYSVIEAFDSHKVKVIIKAGDMSVEIPYYSFKSVLDKQVNQYGGTPTVSINIDQFNSYYIPELMPEDALLSVGIPQKLGIYIQSDKKNEVMEYTDKNMIINVKAKSRFGLYGKDVITYQKNNRYNKWEEVKGKYNAYTGNVTFSTGALGVYGLYITDYVKNDPVKPTAHWSEKYRKEVIGNYKLEGISNYNPDNKISEQSMLNIMYGILAEDRTIDVNEYIDKNELRQLTISDITKTGTSDKSTVSREAGINMFVRTYEIINDTVVNSDSNILSNIDKDNSIKDIYKESMAKAIKLGLVNKISDVRAKDNMTYGEMFYFWSKVN